MGTIIGCPAEQITDYNVSGKRRIDDLRYIKWLKNDRTSSRFSRFWEEFNFQWIWLIVVHEDDLKHKRKSEWIWAVRRRLIKCAVNTKRSKYEGERVIETGAVASKENVLVIARSHSISATVELDTIHSHLFLVSHMCLCVGLILQATVNRIELE